MPAQPWACRLRATHAGRGVRFRPLQRGVVDAAEQAPGHGRGLAGQRAMVAGLLQSAGLHGHAPWVCIHDALERLPTHPQAAIDELP